jgi:hypothetical protein
VLIRNHPDINTNMSTPAIPNDSIKYLVAVAKGLAINSADVGRDREIIFA